MNNPETPDDIFFDGEVEACIEQIYCHADNNPEDFSLHKTHTKFAANSSSSIPVKAPLVGVSDGLNEEAKDILAKMLQKNDGIGIGVKPHTTCTPNFLIDQLEFFKEQGVTTIYTGLLPYYENGLQEYFTNPSAENLLKLNDVLEKWLPLNKEEFLTFIIQAQETGIRIVGVDQVPRRDDIKEANLSWIEHLQRNRARNPKEGKYIIHGGYAHMIGTRRDLGREDFSPKHQIAHLLRIPAITLEESGDLAFNQQVALSENQVGAAIPKDNRYGDMIITISPDYQPISPPTDTLYIEPPGFNP